MKRTAVFMSTVMLALGASAMLAAPASAASSGGFAIRGTCGDTFNPSVTGGQASWNISCASGRVRITGYVKDTKKDGLCAYVKVFAGNGESSVPVAKACPEGTKTNFDWRTVGQSDTINGYLFVA